MYLWKVKTVVANTESGGANKFRYVITASKRAEDAYNRSRYLDLGSDESLQEVDLLGSIPSIAESSPYMKLSIFYILLSYIYPAAPSGSATRRVPSGFTDRIDLSIAQKLGIDVQLGPIAVGPGEPVDTSKLGMIVALTTEDIEQARMIISGDVFLGEIPPDDLYIQTMFKVPVPTS